MFYVFLSVFKMVLVIGTRSHRCVLRWPRAVELFEEIQLRGLKANIITFNSTISACAKGAQSASCCDTPEATRAEFVAAS